MSSEVSAKSQSESQPTTARGQSLPRKVRLRWEWNIPLLVRSLCVASLLAVLALAIYFWQSSRIVTELLDQAKKSENVGEVKDQVKWLDRYVRLVPNDVENLVTLAFAVDSQESGVNQNVELARKRLSIALAACGDDPKFDDLRSRLRRKLVPRLLQFGSQKAVEAESEILLLKPKQDDPEALKWLANALLFQRNDSESQPTSSSKHDKQADFWNWLASQPTGRVLQIAAEANPDDVDLAASLLAVCRQGLSLFNSETEVYSNEQLKTIVNSTLERLSQMKDDGHAQYIVYFYTKPDDEAKAKSTLLTALEPALARLAGNLEASEHEMSGDYSPGWDWQIALENARVSGGVEAERICEFLCKLATERVVARQREEAFLKHASLKMEGGDFDTAIEICKTGLKKIEQSPALHRALAIANLNLERVDEAKLAIADLDSDLEFRLKQLDGAVGARMTTSERAVERKRNLDGLWDSSLLKGRLALVEKDYVKATRILRTAFATTASINVEDRVEAGVFLAWCYAQTDKWDLAAQVYDECSLLKPNDKSIKLRTVDAWRHLGAHERVNEQVSDFDDGSFSIALVRAVAIAQRQATGRFSQAERNALLEAIRVARKRLNDVPEDKRPAMEPWRLELLELRFGNSDAISAKEAELESLRKLEDIAERYADVADVQMQSALDLANYGRFESSQLAIDRLEQIANRTKSIVDQANVVLVKSSVSVAKKELDNALKLLEGAMKAMPEQAAKFAKAAVQIEVQADRMQKAVEIMGLVPEESLDFDAVVTMVGLYEGIKGADAARANELSKKIDSWLIRTKKSEGDDSTNCRYIEAIRMLGKLESQPTSNQLLDEVARYFREIDLVRPHWGMASSLGAKVASLKGNPEEAIRLWRRAVRDGDSRISTILDLVRELNLVGRGNEAEIELQRISGFADTLVPVSEQAVSFAIKRGDFSEALSRAEQLTIRNPESMDGWLLRAQTTYAASSALGLDDESKQKLRDKCWAFLEKAHELSGGNSIGVWDARFRFKLLVGDKAGALKLLEGMLSSSLPDQTRFMEVGRRYLMLKEFGSARSCFENNLLVNPRSPDGYLGLADLYVAIGDGEESIKSLRKARELAPKNQAIRERLALNLAFLNSTANEKNNWQEIDSLLSSDSELATPRDTFLGALIGLSRGEKERLIAIEKLRKLSQSSSPEGIDSKRLLANFHAKQFLEKSEKNQTELALENLNLAKQFYEELLSVTAINPSDAAQYVDLLLSFHVWQKEKKIESDLDSLAVADRVLKQLENTTGSSIASLQLRIRLATARGEESTISAIADQWVAAAGDIQSLGMQNLWEITGQTLMRLGRSQESITWLQKLYEKNPKKLGLLIFALVSERQYERALNLCLQSYDSDASAVAATLLAEVAMMQVEVQLPPTATQVIEDAIVKFPESADLLEAVATMRLMQRHLLEAIALFERAEKIDPKRVRTLNNLAMVLSEMPMRQQEALAKIEKAISLYGRAPELLDTLGQVQLRIGRVDEAISNLKEASTRKNDISFRIHLAQCFLAKNDFESAKEEWSKIKRIETSDVSLPLQDKEVLKRLMSQFGEELNQL